MTLPYDLNILDVVLLSVIALFTLRGALRGFLDEVAGLVGILGGIWLAGRYYGELGRIFSQYTTSQWVYITLLTYFINDADFIKKSRMIQPIKETIVVFKQFLPEQYRK